MSTRSILIQQGIIKPSKNKPMGKASLLAIEARRKEFKTDLDMKTARALKILRMTMQ